MPKPPDKDKWLKQREAFLPHHFSLIVPHSDIEVIQAFLDTMAKETATEKQEGRLG
jgi:hypothetical protein